jgi:hypothetical protein
MRGLLLAIVLTTPALADTLSLPDIVKEAQSPPGVVLQRERFPAIDGGNVAGFVIPPPAIDQAMLITPPDVNDPIFLELGTNQLQNRVPRTAWLPRDLSLGAKRAADAVWDVILPKL